MSRFPPTFAPKALGEQAECAFTLQALRRDWFVSKPYGDSAPYDFIVDTGSQHGRPPHLVRVQVRSAWSKCKDAYTVRAGHGGRCEPLTPMLIDFLVAFVVPLDVWYVIPVRALRGVRRGIAFRPHKEHTRSKWERYRNTWKLLNQPQLSTM